MSVILGSFGCGGYPRWEWRFRYSLPCWAGIIAFFSLLLLSSLPKLIFVAIAPWAGVGVALIPALAVIALFLYGFAFGWRHLVVKRATCASPDLPEEFDGYKVMQLSDVHLGTFGAHSHFVSRIVSTINKQRPDLILTLSFSRVTW